MLEKVLRYAEELEKLEAHILSDKEYTKFLVLENELTLNDFVLLDELQMCERWKQPCGRITSGRNRSGRIKSAGTSASNYVSLK